MFPGAIDSLPRPGPDDYMDDPGLEGDVVIDNISDAIEAIETLIGSTAAAGSLQGYVRLGDSAGKGLWVPSGALMTPPFVFNGGFQLWFDATSFASIADATYTAEGWRYGKVGAMVHDVSRSTDVPAVAALHPFQNYSALLDVTTVDSSIAAGDYAIYEHRAEGFLWEPYHQRAFVLPFWVKATKTGVYCVAFVNSGGDRSYVAEYTVNASDTWEFKTVSVSASPSAGTWSTTNGLGLRTVFTLAAGSTFQTTANAWNTGLFYATANQVNACDSTSNNFRLAMVRPNLGTVALPFSPNGRAVDERLAARYCQKNIPLDTAITTASQAQPYVIPGTTSIANTDYYLSHTFAVPMRTTPTVTTFPYTTPANTGRASNNGGADYGANSAQVPAPTATSFAVQNNSGGALAVGSFLVHMGWIAKARL